MTLTIEEPPPIEDKAIADWTHKLYIIISQFLTKGQVARAWAHTTSGGALSSGFNVTVSKTATGIYEYTFIENMSDALYSVNATVFSTSAATRTAHSTSTKSTSQFSIKTFDSTPAAADFAHGVVVFGNL